MTIDPISSGIAVHLGKLILDTVWKIDSKSLTDKIKQQVFTGSESYIQTYEARHGKLKWHCLHMDTPMRLEEVFTDVEVLERSQLRLYETHETLQELYRSSRRPSQPGQAMRQNGIAAANLYARLMVLGSPGIGKSTFLRKVGLEALKWTKGRLQNEHIPVLLELKQFDSSQTQIEQLIAEEFKNCGFPEPETIAKRLLAAGKLLVLLDGLDEVPTEHTDRAITQIENLVDLYSKNRFIASCRIAAYKGGFKQFTDVTMAAFNDQQIKTFIDRRFQKESKTAEECWKLLNSPAYEAVKELAQTPLLLTLLCAVYNESQDFPKKRASLYGEALEVWLKKWASEKRIQHNPIYRELSSDLEMLLLSEIAYDSFVADQLFFNKRDLKGQIRKFLISNLSAPQTLDAEAVLNEIEVQQGILVERARDAYSFSHLTFQEYLTAYHIVDSRQEKAIVEQHLTNYHWKEVFLLVAGLRSADELLALMECETQKLINTDKLTALINWSKQHTEHSEGDYKPAAKRTVALYFARVLELDRDRTPLDLTLTLARVLALDLALARTHAHTLELAYALDCILDLDIALALDIARLKIFNSVDFPTLISQLEALQIEVPSHYEPCEVHQAFADRIRRIWCSALHLDSEWLRLSEEEVQSLNRYFYTNELILRCKKAALRVSPQVWESIESQMLTVSDNETNL